MVIILTIKIKEEQEKITSLIKNKFSLTDDEIREVFSASNHHHNKMISLFEWTDIINKECSYEQKLVIIGFMWDIAFIDSKIEVLLFDTLNKKSLSIVKLLPYNFIKNIIIKSECLNIKVGLAGKIKINDLSSLLLLNPYLIGLRSAVCESFKRESSASLKLAKEIKSHVLSDNK